MLGIAMTAILFSSDNEKTGIFPLVFIVISRFRTKARERMQLTPWQIKVAYATPATPIVKIFTNIMSTIILALEEAARKMKGVFESPNAEKIPVAIL